MLVRPVTFQQHGKGSFLSLIYHYHHSSLLCHYQPWKNRSSKVPGSSSTCQVATKRVPEMFFMQDLEGKQHFTLVLKVAPRFCCWGHWISNRTVNICLDKCVLLASAVRAKWHYPLLFEPHAESQMHAHIEIRKDTSPSHLPLIL